MGEPASWAAAPACHILPRMSKSAQVKHLLATTSLSTGEIARKVGCTTNLVYVLRSYAKHNGRKPQPYKKRPPPDPMLRSMRKLKRQVDRECRALRTFLKRLRKQIAARLD